MECRHCGYCNEAPPKSMTDGATTKHSPEYKDFLFGGNVTLYVGPKRKRMEMHKKLLASISLELDKHVNNDMREGIEGIIYLPDEGEEVLTLFIEWAYTGDYARKDDALPADTRNRKKPKQDPWPSLYKHIQLCVFSDKFNVPILKQLAESKFQTEINSLELQSERDVAGLLMMIGYACDNVPSSDPILKFLAQYAAWKLELLRGTTSFKDLILAQPDFLMEFLLHLKGPMAKPTATRPQEDPIYRFLYGDDHDPHGHHATPEINLGFN